MARQDRQQRYRGLVNSLPVCLYEADPLASARWLVVSSRIELLVGYTAEEWTSDPTLWESSIHPEDSDRVLREQERHITLHVGTPWTSEYRLVHHSGEPAEHMALGAVFSAAEVIPLTFLTVEAVLRPRLSPASRPFRRIIGTRAFGRG